MSLTFSKSTDTEHTEALDSALISASWSVAKAIAGREAAFVIHTAFVGEGAPVRVTGRSESGQNLGTVNETVRSNRCRGALAIPEDLETGDEVYFEVSLPDNGLDGESNRIPVFPAIEITNLQWSVSEARRGDTVTLTADTRGLPNHSEVTITICEYDRDNAHDRLIEIPVTVMDNRIELSWEYEYMEDTDEVPSQEELDRYGGQYNPPEYFFTVRAEGIEFGTEQESGLLAFKDWLEIEFTDRDGNPMADERYLITLADGTENEGNLDENGRARIDDAPPGPYRVDFPDSPGFARVEGE